MGNSASKMGAGLCGCGCLLIVLGLIGPVIAIVLMALAGAGNQPIQ